MIGPNSILEKEFVADGALTKYRVGKKGTNEDDVSQAAAATDKIHGIIQHDAVDNARVRLMVMGISKVEFGGTIVQGDLLTSDANGKVIATTTALNRCIGVAMSDGVLGDIGTVMINPGLL